MAIRAKFYVSKFEKTVVGHKTMENGVPGEPVVQGFVTLNAVTRKSDVDNIDWAKYSPSGTLTMAVSQEAGGAFDAFQALLGKDVSLLIEEFKPEA